MKLNDFQRTIEILEHEKSNIETILNSYTCIEFIDFGVCGIEFKSQLLSMDTLRRINNLMCGYHAITELQLYLEKTDIQE